MTRSDPTPASPWTFDGIEQLRAAEWRRMPFEQLLALHDELLATAAAIGGPDILRRTRPDAEQIEAAHPWRHLDAAFDIDTQASAEDGHAGQMP